MDNHIKKLIFNQDRLKKQFGKKNEQDITT